MKKTLLSVFFAMSIIGVSGAEESKERCDFKCSPTHCQSFPQSVQACKEDCPQHWDACYGALNEKQKGIVAQLQQLHDDYKKEGEKK